MEHSQDAMSSIYAAALSGAMTAIVSKNPALSAEEAASRATSYALAAVKASSEEG